MITRNKKILHQLLHEHCFSSTECDFPGANIPTLVLNIHSIPFGSRNRKDVLKFIHLLFSCFQVNHSMMLRQNSIKFLSIFFGNLIKYSSAWVARHFSVFNYTSSTTCLQQHVFNYMSSQNENWYRNDLQNDHPPLICNNYKLKSHKM